MNKFLIIALMSLLPVIGFSQQSWDVTFAKKTLLKKAAENPVKNLVKVSRSSLTTTNKFVLKLNNADTAYNITIEATMEDGSGQQSWEYTGKPLTISGSDLKKLLTGRSKIKFQYMAIPKDPNLAAVVRIRPVHICTVVAK
jgi:D-alanine-D-alanine ligase-like ATP-grasp enzyme